MGCIAGRSIRGQMRGGRPKQMDGSPTRQLGFDEALERDSVVMSRVSRTVQEDDRASRCREQQGLPGVWTALQLSEVSRFKVGPLCDVVSEPVAQCGTWSGIFRPARQLQGIFSDPARPQPFHEELLSGGSSFMVVDAMEVNHFGAP